MSDWFAPAQEDDHQPSNHTPQHYDAMFASRRSPVLARNGMVASSQPLATEIGLDLLKKGANAAEAAIAVAAALAVTEPCSTGLGGDVFCLYYEASSQRVSCINASGKSPAALMLERLRKDCGDGKVVDSNKFVYSPHTVTVPGAAQGYQDVLETYGSGNFTLAKLLELAAQLAQEGFPVAPTTAQHWSSGVGQLKQWIPDDQHIPLTADGRRGPKAGEIFKNPELARVLRILGEQGAKGFYQGEPGKAIVDAVQLHGGCMTMEDLKLHTSTFPEPICAQYRNINLWQVPPNGQGIAALIALKGLQTLEDEKHCQRITPENIGKADAYHAMIEMMRLGFHDARNHVTDKEMMDVSLDRLLDAKRIGDRAVALFRHDKAVVAGEPLPSSCTVSFQVVDKQGNAISFVNSNFKGFGTGIVPKGCGFSLQNRGFGFSTDPGHPNVMAPNKRPYHTIIPAMTTHVDTGEFHSTLSNMGGNMQPQGHLQLTVAMVAGGLNPQAAIDLSRFCIVAGTREGIVHLEAGIDPEDVRELQRRGHKMVAGVAGLDRCIMGKAQIILRDRRNGVLWGGSDGRSDGCAMGY